MPPRTLPPRTPTVRRHWPKPSDRWVRFRPCLRWDFGFTCAFCLLHEADLYGGQPGEGLGGTTVEHGIARSEDASRKNDYDNCLYACRFCNRSRSAKPAHRGDTRLLDPTRDAWGDHFKATCDRLRVVAGDADGEYTHTAYALDDPRKVARRRARWDLVTDRLRLLGRIDNEITELLRLAHVLRHNLRRFGEILKEIKAIRDAARRALKDLERYAAIPKDAPRTCRCPNNPHHSLPEELDRQTIEVPESCS